VSEKAWRTGGSRMFIDVGKTVSVDDLLKGVIIQSGNDATVALAEHVAGSEEAFAALMNRHAERLGLTSTHFANANGLPDPSQHTTARDLATLSAAMIRDFPEYYPLHAVREFKFNNIVQHNRNRLLNLEPGVDGIKTGHTEAAGYCLVASGEREGMRLIAVILGAASEKVRVAEASKLLGYGFRFYEARKLHAANTALVQAPLWKGAAKTVDLGLERDLYLTVPRAQPGDISVSPEVDPLIVAPVARGERKGTVKVRVNGKDVLERPLVVLQDVRPGNFLRRWLHAILLFFHWW
jgi:D-alanyl-D-alanine carboxypeptidase (penicillin-binding protein 5/6)